MRVAFSFLLLSASNLAIAEEPYRIENGPERFRVTFDDGVSIELVGVNNSDEALPIVWHPDGNIRVRPENWPKMFASPGQNPTHGFVFQFEGLSRQVKQPENDSEPLQRRGVSWRMPGQWLFPSAPPESPQLVPSSSRIPEELLSGEAIDIRIGVTTLEWGPEFRLNANGELQTHDEVPEPFRADYERIKVTLGEDSRYTRVALIGVSGVDDRVEFRVSAIGASGRKYSSRGTTLTTEGAHRVQLFDVPEDIEAYTYRFRPYVHWVTFKDVALHPGQETKCQVVVDDLDAEPE